MLHDTQRIATELKRARTILKDLVNNHMPEEQKIFNVFARYHAFLEDNKELIRREYELFSELDVIEAKLNLYYEVSTVREKRSLLNDAYVGLLFDLSASIEILEDMLEEISVEGFARELSISSY